MKRRGGDAPAFCCLPHDSSPPLRHYRRVPLRPAIIFVFDLSATGVARNAVALADALAADRAVTLVTCRNGGVFGGAATPGGVPIVALVDGRLGLGKLVASTWRLRVLVRRIRPVTAISAGNRGHPLFLPALAGLVGVTRIYRFSNDIDHRRNGRGPGLAKRLFDRVQLAALRRSAARIVAVAPALATDPRLGSAVTVIPNGVDTTRVRALAGAPCPHPFVRDGGPPFVIGIGRLVAQKNFAVLIDAVARTPDLRLIILGEGPERVELAARGAALGDRFSLPGVTDNPFPYIMRAGAVALPSWWEGASNVLLEALALGTPVVASPTAGNAVDVLAGERFGLLADPADAGAWAQALLQQTGPMRVLPGDRAEAFALETTLAAWRALLADGDRPKLAPRHGIA